MARRTAVATKQRAIVSGVKWVIISMDFIEIEQLVYILITNTFSQAIGWSHLKIVRDLANKRKTHQLCVLIHIDKK